MHTEPYILGISFDHYLFFFFKKKLLLFEKIILKCTLVLLKKQMFKMCKTYIKTYFLLNLFKIKIYHLLGFLYNRSSKFIPFP